MTAKKGGTLLVARVAAAPAFADWPTPADPKGGRVSYGRSVTDDRGPERPELGRGPNHGLSCALVSFLWLTGAAGHFALPRNRRRFFPAGKSPSCDAQDLDLSGD
jgi:hypothetical protein